MRDVKLFSTKNVMIIKTLNNKKYEFEFDTQQI